MSEEKGESEERREYLKTVGALVAGLAIGGAAGWLSKPVERVTERVTETVPGPTVTKTVTVTAPAPPVPEFYGWMGKVLDVDLTTGTIKSRDLDEVCPDYKDYIGGRGLGVKILYDEVGPDTDPLGPENVLIFATGPLTGTDATASGRFCIVSKSPLAHPKVAKVPGKAGAIFDSQSGGEWSPEFKFAGFDAIILRGRADHPVYLWIHDGVAELKDATHLWGKTTVETTAMIGEELGIPEAKVACIGPGGENLVRIACVINEAIKPGYGRACGRDGGGAVMGSKNLKAIAVRGTMEIKIAKLAEMASTVRECTERVRPDPITGTGLPVYGTAVLVNVMNGAGAFPTCNFNWGMWKEAAKISGEAMRGEVPPVPKTLTTTKGCYNCIMRCTRITKTPEELLPERPYITIGEGEGPEYETVWALGAQCGVDDLAAVSEAHYLCNELGIDGISTGSTIGCAMELCKEGLLALPPYSPGENPFGDGALLVDLCRKIATREGVGDELAEGSKRLATKYDRPELSMSVKGLEFPAYDPRGVLAHGLAYATSNRGACHLRAYLIAAEVLGHYCGLSPPDVDKPTVEFRLAPDSHKTDLVLIFQHLTAAIDALDTCLFSVFALGADHYSKLLSAATGIDYTAEDLLKIGERIWNLERLFNLREGFTKDDDRLPPRLEETPMPNEIWSTEEKAALSPPVDVPPHGTIEKQPTAGSFIPIPDMLPLYYEKRGWTPEGVPTDEKLGELGLGWAK